MKSMNENITIPCFRIKRRKNSRKDGTTCRYTLAGSISSLSFICCVSLHQHILTRCDQNLGLFLSFGYHSVASFIFCFRQCYQCATGKRAEKLLVSQPCHGISISSIVWFNFFFVFSLLGARYSQVLTTHCVKRRRRNAAAMWGEEKCCPFICRLLLPFIKKKSNAVSSLSAFFFSIRFSRRHFYSLFSSSFFLLLSILHAQFTSNFLYLPSW